MTISARLARVATVAGVATLFLGLAAPAITWAADTPPTVPAGVTVTAVADSLRSGSVDVAWAPSSDDVAVTGYVVLSSAPGGGALTETRTNATTVRLAGVHRGTPIDVRVRAVDETGQYSGTSAVTTATVPLLPVTIVGQLLAPKLAPRACAGAVGACTVEDRRGLRLGLDATPATELVGANVHVELTWRAPGTTRFVDAGDRTVALDASGTTQPLAGLVRRSGTTCIRVASVEGDDLTLTTGSPTCVRFRPPVEVGWAGDIVVGSHYGLPPNRGRDQFSAVRALLRAPDLMVGNYEGTFSRGGPARCSGGALCYLFQSPPERARNLATAGFDVLNLANNHALDFGEASRRQTAATIRTYGMTPAGLPGSVTIVQVEDTRIAFVGATPYPGTDSLRSAAVVSRLVHRARAQADVVVFLTHVGLEGAAGAHVPHGSDYGTNTRAALHGAIDAGADVVLGSGPHVVRGVERYHGHYIVYSVGNFAGWHSFGIGGVTAQSGVVRFTFDHRGDTTGGTWDGVHIDGPGIPRPDRSGSVVRRVAELSRADFGASAARFTRGGRFR